MIGLKPICEHTEESKKRYESEWNDLIKKLTERGYINELNTYPSMSNCAEGYKRVSGYANYMYNGTLKSDLIDLTPLQVAMICDGGYSWFGGHSDKNGLRFEVKISTD